LEYRLAKSLDDGFVRGFTRFNYCSGRYVRVGDDNASVGEQFRDGGFSRTYTTA
jgi:hypothetical protein